MKLLGFVIILAFLLVATAHLFAQDETNSPTDTPIEEPEDSAFSELEDESGEPLPELGEVDDPDDITQTPRNTFVEEESSESSETEGETKPDDGKALKFNMRVGAEFGGSLITGHMNPYSSGGSYLGFLTFRTNLPFLPIPNLEVGAKIGFFSYRLNDPLEPGDSLSVSVLNIPFELGAYLLLANTPTMNIAIQIAYCANIMFINMESSDAPGYKAAFLNGFTSGVVFETYIIDKIAVNFQFSPLILFEKEKPRIFLQFSSGVGYRF
jgi:hypothetical protein